MLKILLSGKFACDYLPNHICANARTLSDLFAPLILRLLLAGLRGLSKRALICPNSGIVACHALSSRPAHKSERSFLFACSPSILTTIGLPHDLEVMPWHTTDCVFYGAQPNKYAGVNVLRNNYVTSSC